MESRLKFHPIFTENFFKIPELPQQQEVEVYFIPTTGPASLADFLKLNGKKFHSGVKNLIDRLTEWCKQQNIYNERTAICLHNLLHNKNNFKYDGKFPRYNIKIYPLFTDGVILLAKIIQILERELPEDKLIKENTLTWQKTVIKEFISRIYDLCGPGIHTQLLDTYLQLTQDVGAELVTYRLKIADFATRALTYEHQRKPQGPDNDILILPNEEIHFRNKLLRSFTKELAIIIPDDHNEPPALPSNFIPDFSKTIVEQIDLKSLINYLFQRNFYWQEFLLKNAPDVLGTDLDNVTQTLEKYGPDKFFTVRDLVYDEKNDIHIWLLGAEFYLTQSLLRRLAHSGWVNLETMKQIDLNNKRLYLFNDTDVDFSFIRFSDGPIPEKSLPLYYAEELLAGRDITELEQYLTANQIIDLKNQVYTILEKMGNRLIKNTLLPINEKVEFIEKLIQLTPDKLLLILSLIDKLPEKEQLYLLKIEKLTRSVAISNDLTTTLHYATRFSPDDLLNFIKENKGNRQYNPFNPAEPGFHHTQIDYFKKIYQLMKAISEILQQENIATNSDPFRMLLLNNFKTASDYLITKLIELKHAVNYCPIDPEILKVIYANPEHMLELTFSLINLYTTNHSFLNKHIANLMVVAINLKVYTNIMQLLAFINEKNNFLTKEKNVYILKNALAKHGFSLINEVISHLDEENLFQEDIFEYITSLHTLISIKVLSAIQGLPEKLRTIQNIKLLGLNLKKYTPNQGARLIILFDEINPDLPKTEKIELLETLESSQSCMNLLNVAANIKKTIGYKLNISDLKQILDDQSNIVGLHLLLQNIHKINPSYLNSKRLGLLIGVTHSKKFNEIFKFTTNLANSEAIDGILDFIKYLTPSSENIECKDIVLDLIFFAPDYSRKTIHFLDFRSEMQLLSKISLKHLHEWIGDFKYEWLTKHGKLKPANYFLDYLLAVFEISSKIKELIKEVESPLQQNSQFKNVELPPEKKLYILEKLLAYLRHVENISFSEDEIKFLKTKQCRQILEADTIIKIGNLPRKKPEKSTKNDKKNTKKHFISNNNNDDDPDYLPPRKRKRR